MDHDDDEEMEAFFEQLHELNIIIDLTELPRYTADSETAVRLRREEEISASGELLHNLDENDPLWVYLQELALIPVCGDLRLLAEELKKINHSGEENTMVTTELLNLSLSRVVELACGYAGKGVLLMDLIQEASMGLWEAMSVYTGGDFETYRDSCIHWSMTKAIVSQAYASGIGQRLRQSMEDYRSVDERLLSELGRNPTVEEIADGLHMSVQEAEMVATMVANVRNLNRAKQPEPEQLPQEEDQAVEDTAYFQMRQRIAELLSGLSAEDAKLLTLRYGLEGGIPLDPVQTGLKLGMTAQEVINREAAALAKLRQ
jgi:RNA polymerase primary sigma factor